VGSARQRPVFCHENGDAYTSDQLNWRFSKMTRKAGIDHGGTAVAIGITGDTMPLGSATASWPPRGPVPGRGAGAARVRLLRCRVR
jgi:hypothetical protein